MEAHMQILIVIFLKDTMSFFSSHYWLLKANNIYHGRIKNHFDFLWFFQKVILIPLVDIDK